MVFSSILGKTGFMQVTDRLRKTGDFERVYRTGRSKSDARFVLCAAESPGGETRLGVSVSKKVGNSVVRHRIKRLVKEAWRISGQPKRSGMDYVVIARRGAAQAAFSEVQESLEKLARRLDVCITPKEEPSEE